MRSYCQNREVVVGEKRTIRGAEMEHSRPFRWTLTEERAGYEPIECDRSFPSACALKIGGGEPGDEATC